MGYCWGCILLTVEDVKGGKFAHVTSRSVDPPDLHRTKSIKNY